MTEPLVARTVRLDVWLWAARFYKTRVLAKDAVALGKVEIGGQRAKPARAVRVGDVLQVQRGDERFEVTVLGLSDVRGPAPVAQALYGESRLAAAASRAGPRHTRCRAQRLPRAADQAGQACTAPDPGAGRHRRVLIRPLAADAAGTRRLLSPARQDRPPARNNENVQRSSRTSVSIDVVTGRCRRLRMVVGRSQELFCIRAGHPTPRAAGVCPLSPACGGEGRGEGDRGDGRADDDTSRAGAGCGLLSFKQQAPHPTLSPASGGEGLMCRVAGRSPG